MKISEILVLVMMLGIAGSLISAIWFPQFFAISLIAVAVGSGFVIALFIETVESKEEGEKDE